MSDDVSIEPDFDHYSNHPDGAREVGDGATCVICGLPFPCPSRPDVSRVRAHVFEPPLDEASIDL
jgi:hypothetical protein